MRLYNQILFMKLSLISVCQVLSGLYIALYIDENVQPNSIHETIPFLSLSSLEWIVHSLVY